MHQTLAVIGQRRMTERIESVVGQLVTLYGMAIDKSARKNFRRAITSTKNALRVYEHHNLKPSIPEPTRKTTNPQKSRYLWHG